MGRVACAAAVEVPSGQESWRGVVVGGGVGLCPTDTYKAPEVLMEWCDLSQGKEVAMEGVRRKAERERGTALYRARVPGAQRCSRNS